MVFELMVRPHDAEAHPWKIFILSFLLSIAGYIIGYVIFPDTYSTSSVLLTSLFITPIITGIFISEEFDEERGNQHIPQIISVFWMMFLGAAFAYIAIYVLPFPKPYAQLNEISRITGAATIPGEVGEIISNNLNVLLLTYLFSFLFGATSIFILIWNASIVGTWLAKIFVSSAVERGVVAIILSVISGMLSIAAHGFLEFTAYFLSAIAGGIISMSMLRKSLHKNLDISTVVFAMSVVLIVAAGIIEGML